MEKELYGLEQPPRAWYLRMDEYIQRLCYKKSYDGPNLYIKVVKNKLVIILSYVDDLLLIDVKGQIQECKKKLASKFGIKDIGLMHYYLGLEVLEGLDEIYLGQGKYVIEMLKRFDMMD